MRSFVVSLYLAGLSLVVSFPTPAMAGVYTDDLSRCLASRTSDADKLDLAKWIFSVMTLHPAVSKLSSISDQDRLDITRRAGAIFETLLTDTCKAEAQEAVKYEGSGAIENSFKTLGEIAMTALVGHPSVAAGSADIAKYISEEKMQAVFKDVRQ